MTTPGTSHQDRPLIEVLFFDGCPNHEALLPHLRRLLEQAGVHGDVRLVEVPDDAAAQRLHFLGSPTVRINGRDVDPAAAGRQDYALQCRLYDHDGRRTGTPADQWIVAALTS